MSNQEMPKVKELFVESWNNLKASFGNIFLLSLLGSILGIVLTLGSLVGIAGASFLVAFGTGSANQTEILNQVRTFLTPTHLAQIGFGLLAVILISWVISTVVRLGIISAVGKSKEKPTLGSCISSGFALLIPTMVIGILTSLVVFGSWFLLIIPAIAISLFFSFVTYEMVLGGKKWFSAISGSVQIMSQHFGEVLIRMILFALSVWVLYIPIYVLKMIATGFSDSAPGESMMLTVVISIIQFIVGIVVSFYGISYGVTTYQQAKAATDETVKPKLAWIWVVSALGWVIAILIGLQLVKVYHSPMIQEKIKTVMDQAKTSTEKTMSEQEKMDAWHTSMSPEVKELYDQSQDLFKQMREAQSSNPKNVTKLADQNLAVIKKAIALDDKNPELWINLSSAYTWNTSKGTLQDALDASKKAEEADPSIAYYGKNTAKMYIYNEQYDNAILKLQEVLRIDDNYGRAHVLLGIAYKRTGLKDSAKTELQKGIDILTKYNDKGDFDADILQAKKELETVDQVPAKTTSVTTAKPVASCTAYPIREGEFASNKCYVKKDYDDLQYYLAQYNNAAMSYNGAASSSSITCNGSDFFKSQCEEDKQTMTNAQSKIDGYKTTIKAIIARGK